ncbi:phenazine biosynthesis-like protein [Aspergillus avenaceus]|uniref:Phenazine biosynthesis-like protein n=1 Tax=Aspergillus avenaceus TaxID=36643 RepID=A0A5N6U7I1_ASPAV|nr:phenazine biosynthesis-like protein [Aspergillus avenaceus]
MSHEQASYVTLDVFATERFKGNPLAIVKTSGLNLSQHQKQQIAKEFNFSETVFLHDAAPDQNPRVDIFTPVNEMELAGHPIVGTGHLLFRQLLADKPNPPTELTVITKAGPVAVSYDATNQVVSAEIPHNVRVHQQEAPLDRIIPVQASLKAASDLRGLPETSAVVSIVRGVTYVLMDMTERADLFAGLVPGESPTPDLDEGWSPSFTGIMFFRQLGSRVDGDTTIWDLRVRMIAINLEDPACGSGGCSLGAYLALANGAEGRKHRFYINQGSEMGRESHIIVEVVLTEEGDRVQSVKLAGEATFVAEGKVFVE